MSPTLEAEISKSRWESAKTWLWGAVWTVVPAVLAGAADILDDLRKYEGPIDWDHVQTRVLAVALGGLVLYLRKETQVTKALNTPMPGGVDAAVLKRSAEAAQEASARVEAAPVVLVVPTVEPKA